jgi:polar amino acid transport system substrate-binding protein
VKKVILISTLILILISVFIFLKNSDDGINDIRILTENYPPLQYINERGEIDGFATEVILKIINDLEISKNIELLEWDEAYKLVLKEDNIALFSMMRNAEREDKFRWVGPIGTLKVGLYRNDFDDIEIRSLKDAKNYKISAVKDYGYTENLINIGFENVIQCESEKEALDKLLSREVDLYLTSNIAIDDVMKTENIPFYSIEKEFNVSISQFYIAFSKTYPDSLIKKWEESLKKIKKEHNLLFIEE